MSKGFEEIEEIIGEVLAEEHSDDDECVSGDNVSGFMGKTDWPPCEGHGFGCVSGADPYIMGIDLAADKGCDIESNADDTLSITLSTGTSYTIECDQTITASLLENIDGIKENLTTIRRMLFDVISQNDNDLDVVVSHEIRTFFNELGIEENYFNVREDISNREVAMLMCFDAINVVTAMLTKVEGI